MKNNLFLDVSIKHEPSLYDYDSIFKKPFNPDNYIMLLSTDLDILSDEIVIY